MSVICCNIPNLLWMVTNQHQPKPDTLPTALVGPDNLIWAVGPQAYAMGVAPHMSLHQAQSYCPQLTLHPVNLEQCQAAQATLLNSVAAWQLPVEEMNWGQFYVDMHTVAATRQQVQPLAIALGRQVRSDLGVKYTPQIGWDSGKFTAHAAAEMASPGRIRLVSREDEVRFLSPLSINLLPLSMKAKDELKGLGIHTLGRFAQLSRTDVIKRYGPAALMAYHWSQGDDPRPVRNTIRSLFSPLTTEIDPPTGLIDPVLDALLRLLRPALDAFALALEGCRKLNVDIRFLNGATRMLHITFVTAVTHEANLRASIKHHLQTLNWPAEADQVTVSGVETGELPAEQLSLFPEFFETVKPGHALVQRLKQVYGPVFRRGKVPEPLHLLSSQCAADEEWV